jgi:hypothetical protein
VTYEREETNPDFLKEGLFRDANQIESSAGKNVISIDYIY